MIKITFSFLGLLTIVSRATVVRVAAASSPTCSNAAVKLTHDYAYVAGSADFFDPDGDSESGSTFRLPAVQSMVNGRVLTVLQEIHGSGEPTNGTMSPLPTLPERTLCVFM
jgi:hypothetical protein